MTEAQALVQIAEAIEGLDATVCLFAIIFTVMGFFGAYK